MQEALPPMKSRICLAGLRNKSVQPNDAERCGLQCQVTDLCAWCLRYTFSGAAATFDGAASLRGSAIGATCIGALVVLLLLWC